MLTEEKKCMCLIQKELSLHVDDRLQVMPLAVFYHIDTDPKIKQGMRRHMPYSKCHVIFNPLQKQDTGDCHRGQKRNPQASAGENWVLNRGRTDGPEGSPRRQSFPNANLTAR